MSWTKEKWQWHKSLELESLESVIEMIRSVDLFTESQSVNWNQRVRNTSKCCVSACQLFLFVTLAALLAYLWVLIRSTAQNLSVPHPWCKRFETVSSWRPLPVHESLMRPHALNKTEGALAGGPNEQIFSVQFVNWNDLFLLANRLWRLSIIGITAEVTVGEWLMTLICYWILNLLKRSFGFCPTHTIWPMRFSAHQNRALKTTHHPTSGHEIDLHATVSHLTWTCVCPVYSFVKWLLLLKEEGAVHWGLWISNKKEYIKGKVETTQDTNGCRSGVKKKKKIHFLF